MPEDENASSSQESRDSDGSSYSYDEERASSYEQDVSVSSIIERGEQMLDDAQEQQSVEITNPQIS